MFWTDDGAGILSRVTILTGGQRESYGKAELRLRLLLFGDGTDDPGRVRGDDFRERARIELHRMRNAFDAATPDRERRPDEADERIASLEEDLRRIASSTSHPLETPPSEPDLMTQPRQQVCSA